MAEYSLKETLLKIEGVSLTLGGKLILRDVNAEVKNVVREGMQQGQVVGLLGPSGVGKTRLFRILAGLDQPDSGRVLLGAEGKPVTRGSVGVVAQDYPLFAHRTVLSNLLVAAKQAGKSEKDCEDLLEKFGLAGHEKKYPAQLSGGNVSVSLSRSSFSAPMICCSWTNRSPG
ncbi:MAG: ATP-binding cassette domain-containing protein [Armatimonas sp.]